MSPRRLGFRYLALACLAASLANAFHVSPVVAGESAKASVDPEAAARENWRSYMTHNPASEEGCFHASYPSYSWESVQCKVAAHPRFHPVPRKKKSFPEEVTGDRNDYVAQTPTPITTAIGTFPSVTGVTSETGVGVAAFGGGGILGANEYSLQINSNSNDTTSVCASHSGCTVWEQFVYAPDYATEGEAAIFIESWLLGWGFTACPSGFEADGQGDCVTNSSYASVPDEPITSLGELSLTGSAYRGQSILAGIKDSVTFSVGGTEISSVVISDNIVEIRSVWNEAEFNVVGNAGGSEAVFNSGSSVTVLLSLIDNDLGTPSSVNCVAGAGTTGETNNLNLGTCTTTSGSEPTIEFTESN